MKKEIDYIALNKATWNAKTPIHITSDFYDNENFIKGKSSLNEIELNLLGDITGKSILHLQCHFGQDTISLTRLGAQATGVDFSDKAITTAQQLATTTRSDAQFVCSNIYDLPQHLTGQFDMVFTSYGTIGWLPNLDKWAAVVAHFLKPNGKLVMADFHPTLWMFDDAFEFIQYNYFNAAPIVEDFEGTYAQKDAPINQTCVTWNHPISELLNNLIKHGLSLNSFDEFDYSPYNCFDKMIEAEEGKYRIEHWGNKLPIVYALVAQKNTL